jgi:hypothetical protein
MTAAWKDTWLDAAAGSDRDIWRGVEAQHVIATMRLVDSVEEQQLLEEILDANKPAVPEGTGNMHYLLFTPFRYRAPQASRFRPPNARGVFYGADERETVAAELAHWRWKFLMDSEGPRELESLHTFFLVHVSGLEVDLTAAPWNSLRERWRNPSDYGDCHRLAREIEERAPFVASIRYESARREGAWCNAVLDPSALSLPEPFVQQTWSCKTTPKAVLWAHEGEFVEFAQPLP